jgi:GntR family transcriptional repressor for pyruvate dehydrogenase complex
MDTEAKLINLKSSKKLYLQVYDEIKKYIKDNNLQPGDKLPTEMEMCSSMGVSRNVLREAIKSLEITGVVTSKPGVGIEIRQFNSDFFMSALISHVNGANDKKVKDYVEELRHVLELGFDRKAFDTLSNTEISVMEEQVRIMKSQYYEENSSDVPLGIDFAKADAKFHQVMFSRVDNVLLSSIIDFFWAYDKYYTLKSKPSFIAITIDKHERIVKALKAHDYTAFHDAMVYHFTYEYLKK